MGFFISVTKAQVVGECKGQDVKMLKVQKLRSQFLGPSCLMGLFAFCDTSRLSLISKDHFSLQTEDWSSQSIFTIRSLKNGLLRPRDRAKVAEFLRSPHCLSRTPVSVWYLSVSIRGNYRGQVSGGSSPLFLPH